MVTWCFLYIYVFLYFLMLTHLLGTYCSFQIVILSFILIFISKYIYCNVAEIYHTCCVHFFVHVILSAMVIQSFVFLFCQAIWWSYLSEITSGVISSLEWLFLPHIMHLTYIHMDVSISVTYFMYCCIRHVFLFFGGSIWQSSFILVFNS